MWHDPSQVIHFFSEGHRQLKCQAHAFKEDTVRELYDECNCSICGQNGSFMFMIQSVRYAGSVHDLVERAAEERGGPQPSNYNMHARSSL